MQIKPEKPEHWWDDEEFQNNLVSLLTQDHETLKTVGNLLTPEDFRPLRGMKNGRARWMVAERALEYFQKHRTPLGNLLRADVLEYANQINLGSAQVVELREYVATLQKQKAAHPGALTEKVLRYKSQRLKAAALQEMTELQLAGQLTEEKWLELTRAALINGRNGKHSVNFFNTYENRITSRALGNSRVQIPWTFIDPLDEIVKCVGRKQLGLAIAPWKRGKSTFLVWLAIAYALQRLNVLYFTLEDALNDVEERLDAAITHIPVAVLNEYPQTYRKRFERFRSHTGPRIELVDGTDGGISLAVIEEIILQKREEGFFPDALIIDYDEKIQPARHLKEKRFEYDELYNGLNNLISKHNLIGWTAAQTQRDTRHLKILSGDRVAEDIGKMRKVVCGLSLGKGEWTEDSIYLWVAAHKHQPMERGCEIVPNLKESCIYDREATRKAQRQHVADVPGDDDI